MMRRLLFPLLAAAALAACQPAPAPQREPLQMQTIDRTPPRLAAVDPPPTLEQEAIPSRPTPGIREEKVGTKGTTPEEELKAKTNLPFTPHIAMDPVDGSKVSITAETPVLSHEDRWYYFSTEANKRAFAANPEEYLKGQLARY